MNKMKEDEPEIALKIVIVGNGVVGKSSLIQRFCKGIFTNEYKKTLGVDFLERVVFVRSETIRLMLWDTAGQEEFEALTKAYYRGAQACVIVFSTTDRESFKNVENWKKKVEYECGKIPMALVQNKIDLINESVVKRDEVENLVKRHKWKFFRTSVKDNINVDNIFRSLVESYLISLNEESSEEPVLPHLSLYQNNSYLRSAIIPTQSLPTNAFFNPVCSRSNFVSKYRKKDKKQTNYFNHGIGMSTHMGGNGITNHHNNYHHHHRYKPKLSLIPIKQNPTILLHNHRQYHYHHHQALHHNYHYVSSPNKNDNMFKNCKIF